MKNISLPASRTGFPFVPVVPICPMNPIPYLRCIAVLLWFLFVAAKTTKSLSTNFLGQRDVVVPWASAVSRTFCASTLLTLGFRVADIFRLHPSRFHLHHQFGLSGSMMIRSQASDRRAAPLIASFSMNATVSTCFGIQHHVHQFECHIRKSTPGLLMSSTITSAPESIAC